jgi:hypothetical protein
MKDEIRTINWTMKNGWHATVTITHVTSEPINADGHVVNVECNRVDTMLEISEANVVERDFWMTDNVTLKAKAAGAHATIRTSIGIIGVPENIYREITTVIAEFTPKREAVKEIKRGFGWCEKCQSYCYGDCEA